MGAGLLAKASVQAILMVPDTPLSRASPLPHLISICPQDLITASGNRATPRETAPRPPSG
ncbi:hypothetical protein C1884_24540 [Pseudomonas sp. GW460-R15]|nr:hypothetical protein C1887_17725 [Pseudomonas sp. GW456-R21]POA63286.1 hypothetical protein C1884_24540 [Pseudomonas sp. GW460-R15]